MGYKETLARMIDLSGLSLREISTRCLEYDVKVAHSYISRLQSGALPPASDEINTALAKVCEFNSEELLYEAYMEKAPKLINEIMINFINYFKDMQLVQYLGQASDEVYTSFEKYLNEIPDYQYISGLKEELEQYDKEKYIELYLQKQREDKLPLPNLPSSMNISMWDDSMSPYIPKDAKLHIKQVEKIENGNLIVLVRDEEMLCGWYYCFQDERLQIFRDNKRNQMLDLKKEDVTVLGKVVSFIVEV